MFQGALAKAAGMGQTAVSNYEHGEREMSVTIMQRLAKALGISDEELLNADPPDSEGDTP
jgi:transcriptional regulator with XRE-family HTH domain